jgi:hypothetical protein
VAANPKHNSGHDAPVQPILDTFRLVAETRRRAEEIATTAREAVKEAYSDPAQLASFIESHQTPVFVLSADVFSKACLWSLGFAPGFIPPSDSRRYRCLQAFLRLQAGLTRKPNGASPDDFKHGVFVLPRPLFTVGFISHQLHHWLAFRSGLMGYCDRAQALYRKFWDENQGQVGAEVYDMTAEDIMALKAAINRDLEALEFLRGLARDILVPTTQSRHFTNHKRTSA